MKTLFVILAQSSLTIGLVLSGLPFVASVFIGAALAFVLYFVELNLEERK